MKAITGFILLLISTTTFAQTEKGSFMVGGTLGFSSTNISSATITSLNLSPNISYFPLNQFAAGIVTPYSTAKGSENGKTYSTSWNYSVGPTVRYYFLKGPANFFPIVTYSWGWSHSKSIDPTTGIVNLDASGNTTFFEAGGGFTYFINRNVGIEGIFSYQENHLKYRFTTPASEVSTSTTGLRFQIGLQIYLVPRNQ